MDATKLMYLEDTYLLEGAGEVIGSDRDERGRYLIFDQTVMYPQGGGQPSDTGALTLAGVDVPVSFVGFLNGVVRHYIPARFDEHDFSGSVTMRVDSERRIANAKLHSGGHLISHVLEELVPGMNPIKGYHFPDGAHVEFMDEGRNGSSEKIEEYNDKLREAIASAVEITARMSDADEVAALRPELAALIPKDKPTRIVQIGSYRALPCGGTHISSTADLGGIQITKVKRKKDNIKISYTA